MDKAPRENTLIRTRINTKILCCFVFMFVLFSVGGEAAQAASLYFYPSSGSYQIGRTFSVGVYVSSTSQSMNAASGIVSFSPDKLQVISLSKTGSIFNLWVREPAFSNTTGTVNFEGIVLNPGFIGSSGKLLTVNFRGKKAGSVPLTFTSGSVLANDGKGTNILGTMGNGSYNITGAAITPPPEERPPEEYTPPPTPSGTPKAPVVSSPTHPDENKWYSNNNPEFIWKLPSDVTAISYAIDESPSTNPKFIAESLVEKVSFQNLQDGIWYFHINFKNKHGWGKLTHRKVLIDITPPEPFEIEVQKEDPTDPQPIILFETTDSLSGIEYYEVKIGRGDPFQLTVAYLKKNPYQMPLQAPGKRNLTVKAIDKAGNFTFTSADLEVLPIEPPTITKFSKGLIMGQPFNLEGESLPGLTIKVFLQKRGAKSGILLGETKANEEGKWSFSSSESLEKGDYTAWARAQDKRGALSLSSKTISFWVGLPPLLKFGKIVIDYLTVMITLIILIIGAFTVIFYMWYRISLWKKRLRRETKEAEEKFRKAFLALREEIEEQVAKLDGKRGLSASEKKVCDKLKEALDISEEFVGKEIKDIEKELE